MRAHPEALYFHIARRVLDDIEHEKDEFELAQRVGTAIVFSALTLEAFINQEFGLHPETRKIIEEEKGLTLKAKWLILPLLLQCSSTFAITEMPFQKFSELVTVRNAIFHFNPANFDPNKAFAPQKKPRDRFFSDLVKDIELAKSYFGVIEKMISKLHELTGGKTELPKFLSGHEYITTIWGDIRAVIEISTS
jgi:hypothetical protein